MQLSKQLAKRNSKVVEEYATTPNENTAKAMHAVKRSQRLFKFAACVTVTEQINHYFLHRSTNLR